MQKTSRTSTAWDLEVGQTAEAESDPNWSQRPTTAPAGDYPDYITTRGRDNTSQEFDRRSRKITEEVFEEVSDGSERENTPIRSIRSPVTESPVTQAQQRPIPRPRKASKIENDRERDRDRHADGHSDLEHEELARSRYTEGRSDRKNHPDLDHGISKQESRRDIKKGRPERDTKRSHRGGRDLIRPSDSSDTGSSRDGSIKSADSDAGSEDVKEILKTTSAQILLGDGGNDSDDLNQLKE